ncbi:MATE family efflux transporter [uncultured Roseovarius sp.]|uniref:MATE family efflux transporter n=1 Tax=uncultured Roseovarius sp. TaxID=293344 RepID=UPI00260EF20F|nr:MATE family efflux transporter [uncultured Roseovarius sp.]
MAQPPKASFTEGNLMKHVSVMSLTSSLGIMAIYVVDLCDIFFISLLGEKEMAAAAGFASTLMFFISAISIGVSIATGSLVSAALGVNDRKTAREIATTAAVVVIGVSIILPTIFLLNLEYLLSLIGATGVVAEMASRYLWIILPSTVLSGISMVAVSALRADGEAKWSMYPSLLGALVNLVADPIFIFALGFGLEGAAMATVLARMATFSVANYATIKRNNLFASPNANECARHLMSVLRYTFPAVFSSLAAPVGMAIVMRYIARFGPEAVAGMAVVGRLYPVVFSVVSALSGSIGPIIGQNFGAGFSDRVKEAYFDALKFLLVYVICIAVILFLTRSPIADAFSLSGLSRDLLYLFCGPLAIVAFFNGSIFVSNALHMNVGKPRYPVMLSWGRTMGMIPFAELGSRTLGAEGVFVGVTAGGLVFSAIAISLSMRTMGNLSLAKSKAATAEDGVSSSQEIMQSERWEG